ncbi:MAG: HD domain-containing protein [Phascolarctobacterium sp.]|nr:HD domain-containing protein [Phascolarctobacterium sp.]
MNKELKLFNLMLSHDGGNSHRIQHFLKVHGFAIKIAEEEKVGEELMEIIRAVTLVHDVGIKIADEKYGKHFGPLQEKEGWPVAEAMCLEAGYSEAVAKRVGYLVGHHHTYTNIDGLDYQILVEADFLVNMHEDQERQKAIINVYEKIFKTKTGKHILKTMFALEVE